SLQNLSNYYWLKANGTLGFKTESYFPILVAIYLIGIVLQLSVLLMGYAKLKQLKKASTIKVPAVWKTIFDMTVFQLKIKKPISFYLSEKVNVPLVIGFFKPVILFPVALATQLDQKQVEAILIHELSHIRRNDYLLNLFKTFIETLLFFNPFVWLTTKLIQIEREHACDDLVVELTETPLTYAHALLKLEILKEQSPALAMAATGKNQHLYQRIKRITAMKTNYINVKQQVIILALTIATVFSVAWINPTKEAKKPAKPYSLEKLSAVESSPLNKHLVSRADTDTVKRKRKQEYVIRNNGKTTVYTNLEDMPDSVRKSIVEMERKFNSKEWKDKVAKIEFNAAEIEKRFNSPEWKEKFAKIEFDSKEMEKRFNSPEWKDKMAKIEFNAKEIEKRFNSPEWKDKMAKIELNAKEIEKRFNSPEWKDKMAKIELNAKEIEKKFNSPEWKQKMEDIKKLHDSPEYKELQEKFEKDVKELKKKKGMKDDKVLIIPGNAVYAKDFFSATR
ncbi:MAG: peptidase M56, partial [Pedobacter sp.]